MFSFAMLMIVFNAVVLGGNSMGNGNSRVEPTWLTRPQTRPDRDNDPFEIKVEVNPVIYVDHPNRVPAPVPAHRPTFGYPWNHRPTISNTPVRTTGPYTPVRPTGVAGEKPCDQDDCPCKHKTGSDRRPRRTLTPTAAPTEFPSRAPTSNPTLMPSTGPTQAPTPTPTTAVPTSNPTAFPTGLPTPAPTTEMAEPQDGSGCSNAEFITLAVLTDVEDEEACAAECFAYGGDCEHAQFTSGWIPWGNGHFSGGYDDVVNTPEVQDLLLETCKITPCGEGQSFCAEDTDDLCKAAGTFGCPDDEPCVSVGPASAGCGEDIGAHTAIECVDEDNGQHGSIDIGSVLTMDTYDDCRVEKVSGAQCGGTPHANSCFGPYQDSAEFEAFVGDELSWTFSAEPTGDGSSSVADWYEVMVLILREGVPVAIPTYRYGNTTVTAVTNSWTVDTDSTNYQIRFLVGSYDHSGKQKLGAVMDVHAFERRDSQGQGYKKCRLLGSGCDEQPMDESSLSSRSDPTPAPSSPLPPPMA